jgi:hypothetical protein
MTGDEDRPILESSGCYGSSWVNWGLVATVPKETRLSK